MHTRQAGLALVKESQEASNNIYFNRDYLCVVQKPKP
jgi:hypothetical protein